MHRGHRVVSEVRLHGAKLGLPELQRPASTSESKARVMDRCGCQALISMRYRERCILLPVINYEDVKTGKGIGIYTIPFE